MRLDVKKYLFFGHRDALQSFFEKAQEAGVVQFIDTREMKVKEIPADIQDMATALKVLRELPTVAQEEPESASEADRMRDEIVKLRATIDRLEEELRVTRLEIARIEVFGQFSLNDIAYIEEKGNRKMQFFFAKRGLIDKEALPPELLYINSDHGLDYFVSISPNSAVYENMIEMHFLHELNTLREKAVMLHNDIHTMEQRLKHFSKYNVFLHHAFIRMLNTFHLESAQHLVSERVDGKLFAIEGWVPEHKVAAFEKMVEPLDVDTIQIAVEEGETVPTYLENRGAHRIGEDLIRIYDTPSNTDKDPSLWVLAAFALFFAMIIGDGGYGMVFLGVVLYIRYRFGKLKGAGLRVWKLAVILCCSCILWGLFTNSFFGISFPLDSPVRKASVLNYLVEKKAAYHIAHKDFVYKEWVKKIPELANVKDAKTFLRQAKTEKGGEVNYEMANRLADGIMMEFALLAGTIHVIVSFLRYIGRNWSGVGWIMAIVGLYLFIPNFLNATSISQYLLGLDRQAISVQGLYMAYAGIAIAVFIAIVRNKLVGILEITSVTQIFADILSYLRLYALGLAGSIISATINDIAGSLIFMGGVLLIICGHALNMVLAIIGGTIHGLRLNFIEWYHYSFEGGGKAFDPLRKIEVD